MKPIFRYLNILFLVVISSVACACDEVKCAASKAIEHFAAHHKVQSVYAIADHDKIVVHGAHGFYDLATNRHLTVNEQMPIASGTKPFTAAAILLLKDRGLLDLKAPISKYLNAESSMWYDGQVPAWAHKITLHHLLTHSSGLPEYVYGFKIDYKKSQTEVNKDILHFVAKKELEFKPGSKAVYNNTGYMIAGMIVEHVSKQKFADFMHKEIFEPNGMKHTKIAGFNEALEFQLGKTHILPTRYYEIPNNTANPHFKPVGDEIVVAPNGDGGGVSSVEDLIKWNAALHGGKVLSKSSYKKMTHKYFVTKSSGGYETHIGYGMYISKMHNGQVIYHHEGRALGIRSDNGYLPKKGISYAILSNAMLYLPKEMEGKVDFNKPENQVDVLYLRNAVLDAL